MARPVDVVSVPAGRTTVILAMDVSRSMCATDIPPNRLLAAEAAAASFIERQGSTTQIGIVAFAGFAEIVQSPTTDQEVLLDVVESLTTGRRTAVGSAILKSLDAIAEIDESVAPSETDNSPGGRGPGAGPARGVRPGDHRPADRRGEQCRDAASRRRRAGRGSRRARLHDRVRNRRSRRSAARCAARSSSGTSRPRAPTSAGSVASAAAAGAAAFRRAIDEETLIAIAEITGGTYYPAESADELHTVFQSLPTDLITKHEVMEISVAFAALGLVLVALAILLGQAWRPLP